MFSAGLFSWGKSVIVRTYIVAQTNQVRQLVFTFPHLYVRNLLALISQFFMQNIMHYCEL